MINGEIKLRVRYSDTDQMGYVYYGSYKNLEEEGIGMPVIDMDTKYLLPIKYDEEIIIKTRIEELPSSKIIFYYDIFNKENNLANSAKTTLTFINLSSKKPVRIPKELLELIKNKF